MHNGGSSPARVLLVDDYAAWRESVRTMLQDRADVIVVGEAADGLDGVRKVQELKPDLVLLDIGLPGINGLEAAGRISAIAPDTRIVFLTQNTDVSVSHAAMNNGARAYVVKANAARELLPTIEAVLRSDRLAAD